MSKLILIDFTFVNKKGETKTVRFPFDEAYYKDLYHPSITKEMRDSILLDYYKEFCAEQKYKRRVSNIPVDEEGRDIDIADESPSIIDKMIEEEEMQQQMAIINSILMQMSEKQRTAFIKVKLEGKKKREAAAEMGIKENTFNELFKRAEASFESILKNGKF